MADLTLAAAHELAASYGVPVVDVLCIALNLRGLGSKHPHPRMRFELLPMGETEPFLIITPTGVPDSPFFLRDDFLWLGEEVVGRVPIANNDDVVLSYLRDGQRQLTLNSNSRSTCTGCMFCPNIIEDPADARLRSTDDIDRLARWVIADYNWTGLDHLTKISISSGCFHTDRAAIDHLSALHEVAERYRFAGTYHILSSVIRSAEALAECVTRLGAFHLTVTFECRSRRPLLLKETKADLTFEGCIAILDHAAAAGATADLTYIAGLDAFDVAVETLVETAQHVTAFPRIQIYQAHNDLMRAHRTPLAHAVDWFLDLRRALEPVLATRQLRPRPHENYRGLWYTEFAGEKIQDLRI